MTNTNAPIVYVPSIANFESLAVQNLQEKLAELTFLSTETGLDNYYFSSIYNLAEKDVSDENEGRPLTWICKEYKSVQPDDKDYHSAFFYIHGRELIQNGFYYRYDISLLGWLNETAFTATSRGYITREITDIIYRQIFNRNQYSNNPAGLEVSEIYLSTDLPDLVWQDFDPKTFLVSYEKYMSYRIRFYVGQQVGCLPLNNELLQNHCFSC